MFAVNVGASTARIKCSFLKYICSWNSLLKSILFDELCCDNLFLFLEGCC